MAQSPYLNTLGAGLDPEIGIFWTGSKVVSEVITKDEILCLSRVLRRKPLIWDNLHANDYDQQVRLTNSIFLFIPGDIGTWVLVSQYVLRKEKNVSERGLQPLKNQSKIKLVTILPTHSGCSLALTLGVLRTSYPSSWGSSQTPTANIRSTCQHYSPWRLGATATTQGQAQSPGQV